MKCNIICNFALSKIPAIMTELDINDIYRFESSVKTAEKVVIVTHTKPDGDAIGSSTAMHSFISSINPGCKVNIVITDRWPRFLNFLIDKEIEETIVIHSENPEAAENAIRHCDTIICLDFNAFHRTDSLENSLKEAEAVKILIDHHLDPDRESFDIVFSETEISSASELLYSILMKTRTISENACNLPHKAAVALMTGMTTDTNNFANSTYPSTLIMAAQLLAAGVDRDMIISNLYNQYRETRLRIMGLAMKDLMKITPDGVAYIVLDAETLKEYGIEEGETEGFVNMPLSLANVRMSLLLKEEKDRIRVSIRSKKGTSANRCARLYFNGGGHENAAGGKLFVPTDVKHIGEVAEYIEYHTHKFLKDEE